MRINFTLNELLAAITDWPVRLSSTVTYCKEYVQTYRIGQNNYLVLLPTLMTLLASLRLKVTGLKDAGLIVNLG